MTERSKKTFIAMGGPAIEQDEPFAVIRDGYQCWNLKKLALDDFVSEIQAKISPVNQNVLRNYKVATEENQFGVAEETYRKASWGVLIPESLEDALPGGYPSEAMFLLNLYSPKFLNPLFFVTDLGIQRVYYEKPLSHLTGSQKQADAFKTSNFVDFFQALLPQGKYGTWQADRAEKFEKEDWRLFVARMLYGGLSEYEPGKSAFGWQRESADMVTLLEALFTADDSHTAEVGYRLRKRMAALLVNRFPEVERDLKKLYDARSKFVHGSFFAGIPKEVRKSQADMPLPDFVFLYKQKEYVRFALVAYLYLAQLIKEDVALFAGNRRIIDALEQAVVDTELREKLVESIEPILCLMPKSESA